MTTFFIPLSSRFCREMSVLLVLMELLDFKLLMVSLETLGTKAQMDHQDLQ